MSRRTGLLGILLGLGLGAVAQGHGDEAGRHPAWPFGHRRSVGWFEGHWYAQHEAIQEELDDEREYVFHGMSSNDLRMMRKRGAFGGTDRLYHLAEKIRMRHAREYEED